MVLNKNFIIVVSVASLPLVFLSPFMASLLIISFGHGHFSHAYYYQYKAGKFNLFFLGKAVLAIAVFSIIVILKQHWVIVFGMFIFLIHSYLDCFRITGSKIDKLSLISLFSSLISVLLISMPVDSSWFLLIIVSVGLFSALISKNKGNALHIILPFAFASYVSQFFSFYISNLSIFAASIISHYGLWFFYILFKEPRKKRKTFLFEFSAFSLFFVLLAYGAVTFYELNMVLFLFFSMNAYVLWTTIHIFTSFQSHLFLKVLNKKVSS